MSGYRKRRDTIANPGPLLATMRASREALCRASADVKPFGAVYHGLSMVISAIDALAVLLTGERDYFAIMGTGAPDGEKQSGADKLARERGETPAP